MKQNSRTRFKILEAGCNVTLKKKRKLTKLLFLYRDLFKNECFLDIKHLKSHNVLKSQLEIHILKDWP